MVKPSFVHNEKNHICRIDTQLWTKAPARKRNRVRSAEHTGRRPAYCIALAIISADDKRRFLHTGNDYDALCSFQQAAWNPLSGDAMTSRNTSAGLRSR